MSARPLRSAVLLVVALTVLSGFAWVLQQSLTLRPTVDEVPVSDPLAPGSVPVVQPVVQPAAPVQPVDPGAAAAAAVPQVDPAWLRRTATAAGLPETALAAYARAELSSPASCGLGWATLAGIGWVESQHGTLDGRVLGDDGHSSTPILGPALDGSGDVAAIAATPETTAFHGDPVWDHAVGPMQFIPSTWERWAADGDGDGVADPNDLDDAALAAADYLCADGRDLTTGEGWTGGVLSYNHAQVYVDDVHAAATAYADRTA